VVHRMGSDLLEAFNKRTNECSGVAKAVIRHTIRREHEKKSGGEMSVVVQQVGGLYEYWAVDSRYGQSLASGHRCPYGAVLLC
jgi:hypothetical protein